MKSLIYFAFCLATGVIGHRIHEIEGSSWPLFWAMMNFWFAPVSWLKWMLCHEVSVRIINEAFGFFLS